MFSYRLFTLSWISYLLFLASVLFKLETFTILFFSFYHCCGVLLPLDWSNGTIIFTSSSCHFLLNYWTRTAVIIIYIFPPTLLLSMSSHRHPQCDKDIMTQMITPIPQDGVIKSSFNLFSLPMLVRKRYWTFWLCGLLCTKAITIIECFLVPTVDELLDELHGSTIFSKFDLCSGYHQILFAPKTPSRLIFAWWMVILSSWWFPLNCTLPCLLSELPGIK